MLTLREVGGFLFVGDPHLTSHKPGMRKDQDFASVVLAKLEQAIHIANERDLIVVILGDIFDRSRETDETLKTRLMRVLRLAKYKPWTNLGNHDCKSDHLADADTLAVIAESGLLHVATATGPGEEFLVNGIRVGLGFSPAAHKIPTDVASLFPEADAVIWITHHDLAFGRSPYPGAIVPFAINGCDMVINGHMHLYQDPVTVDSTMWFNPGNITRMDRTAAFHVPAVWSFTPEEGLVSHDLSYVRDIMDLVGHLTDDDEDTPLLERGRSTFVERLRKEAEKDKEVTDDAAYLLDAIHEKFRKKKTSEGAKLLILDLHRRAVATREKNVA